MITNWVASAQVAFRTHLRQAGVPAAKQVAGGLLGRGGSLITGWYTGIPAAGLATARGLARVAATVVPAWPSAAGAGTDSGSKLRVLAAGARSRWVDLDGPVHYLDFGGPASGPTVVCVHGLAGAAVNWSAIAPLLASRCRVLALDLPGHGLTQSLGRDTKIPALQDILHRFIEAVAEDPVMLAGNSMGGMLSLLEASAAPDAVAGLVLVDPVLPLVPALPDRFVTVMLVAYAVPGLGPLLMRQRRRMSPEKLVASVLSLCCVDASRIPADVLAQHAAVARQTLMSPKTEREIGATARSILTIAGVLRGGAYRRAVSSITCPVLLLHGTRDRMVPIAVARAAARANPGWTLIEIPGTGHIPQLEAPADTACAITGWLGGSVRGGEPVRVLPDSHHLADDPKPA
jgi:pimeloyl-ACP methyl ester carboxylesterase